MRKYRIDVAVEGAALKGSMIVEAEDEDMAKEMVLERAYDIKFKQIFDFDSVVLTKATDVGPARSMRKMASIQRIVELNPIEGADNIEVATVLGWKCVVKKGDFKPGDLGVYIEIDSILPEKPEFEFMKDRRYRVKTIKLCKQVSQGLMFPISGITYVDLSKYEEESDVTEILEIKKYDQELPGNLRGKIAGNFPSFLKKTDETRIQSMPSFLKRHSGKMFYVTEKLDGSSFTAYLKDDTSAIGYSDANRINKFGICSRNLELKTDEDYFKDGDIKNLFWRAAAKCKVEDKLRKFGSNIAIQGEMVGPGIQKNKYMMKDLNLYIFNVFDIAEHKFFSFDQMQKFCDYLGFEMVPVVDKLMLDHSVDELVAMSIDKSVFGNTQREGLVFRTLEDEYDEYVGRTSFKVINPKFLLKHE